MSHFTLDRRSLLKSGGSLLAVAATMSSEQLLGYAKAWAQSAPWKPEAGAKINLLRWKRFVEAEDVAHLLGELPVSIHVAVPVEPAREAGASELGHVVVEFGLGEPVG